MRRSPNLRPSLHFAQGKLRPSAQGSQRAFGIGDTAVKDCAPLFCTILVQFRLRRACALGWLSEGDELGDQGGMGEASGVVRRTARPNGAESGRGRKARNAKTNGSKRTPPNSATGLFRRRRWRNKVWKVVCVHPLEDAIWTWKGVTVAVIAPYRSILEVDHVDPDVEHRNFQEGTPFL